MAWVERYVTDAGAGAADGTSLANAWSWATMLTSLTSGQRANVKGTITRTTTNDVFTNAGTTAVPMSIRGINSTDGDLESNGRTYGSALVTTNFPVVTYTTGSITLAAFMLAEHMEFTSAKAGTTVVFGGNGTRMRRCKASATHANSVAAIAVDTGAFANCIITDCDCNCSTASSTATALTLNRGMATNCLLTCLSGVALSLTGFCSAIGCMIRDSTTGINLTGTVAAAYECSLRNISGNYINNAATNGTASVENCVAWGSGGSSKWYNSTTSVRAHIQQFNAVGNMGAADTNEGDWPVYNEVALTVDPFTSSTVLTLNNTSGGGAACRAAGIFAYRDIGALQHPDAGSGGGLILPRPMNGGYSG